MAWCMRQKLSNALKYVAFSSVYQPKKTETNCLFQSTYRYCIDRYCCYIVNVSAVKKSVLLLRWHSEWFHLTWAGIGPSEHALHLADGVLPAAGAGLHVRLQLVQPVTEVLVTLTGQRRQFLGDHQFLQVVLQDDHPDDIKNRNRGEMLKKCSVQ